MRWWTVPALAFCLIGGCRRQEAPPPIQRNTARTTTVATPPKDLSRANMNSVVALDDRGAVENARIGTETSGDGMVATDKTVFKRREPILVSMWLKESPAGLQTSARIFDKKGKQVAEERQDMKGAKTVTFSFAKADLKPGQYHVITYWGGNRSREFDFTIK